MSGAVLAHIRGDARLEHAVNEALSEYGLDFDEALELLTEAVARLAYENGSKNEINTVRAVALLLARSRDIVVPRATATEGTKS